ncbi:hypothetical protein FRC03_007695 [Tulasnella sp. 419]|nr:hypothetical protein FRC02_002634 [Tulasnella sp. 418]KAG8959632.1 hypothetical protein FRC03_007695 [Tulasnella sp. 419]
MARSPKTHVLPILRRDGLGTWNSRHRRGILRAKSGSMTAGHQPSGELQGTVVLALAPAAATRRRWVPMNPHWDGHGGAEFEATKGRVERRHGDFRIHSFNNTSDRA